MVDSVWEPLAAFVPDQPPPAMQLRAAGVVDQVSTGVRLPVAEVRFARKVTTPAGCACAADQRNETNSKEDRASFPELMTRPRMQSEARPRELASVAAAANENRSDVTKLRRRFLTPLRDTPRVKIARPSRRADKRHQCFSATAFAREIPRTICKRPRATLPISKRRPATASDDG